MSGCGSFSLGLCEGVVVLNDGGKHKYKPVKCGSLLGTNECPNP